MDFCIVSRDYWVSDPRNAFITGEPEYRSKVFSDKKSAILFAEQQGFSNYWLEPVVTQFAFRLGSR